MHSCPRASVIQTLLTFGVRSFQFPFVLFDAAFGTLIAGGPNIAWSLQRNPIQPCVAQPGPQQQHIEPYRQGLDQHQGLAPHQAARLQQQNRMVPRAALRDV